MNPPFRPRPWSPQGRFRVLTALIVVAFLANMVASGLTTETKRSLQAFDGRLSGLMGQWHQLLQFTNRLTFTDDTPEAAYQTGMAKFRIYQKELAAIQQLISESTVPTPPLRKQLSYLLDGMEFGDTFIAEPYDRLREFIDHNRDREGTVLQDSLYQLVRGGAEHDAKAVRLLLITRMFRSIQMLGATFSNLLEARQEVIRTEIDRELKRLTILSDLIQYGILMIVGTLVALVLLRLNTLFRNLNESEQRYHGMVDDLTAAREEAQRQHKVVLHLSEERRLAEIRALESQVNPHFLYNTLNALNWKAIDGGQMEIARGLQDLAAITRYSISQIHVTATLGDEIRWMKKYLDLQQLRFGKVFHYVIHEEGADHQFRLYKLLFQPLLENAVIHGFADQPSDGLLTVHFEITDQRVLRTEIRDNGRGFDAARASEEKEGHGSVGMENLVQRLRVYYGDRAALQFTSHPGAGTSVVVEFPETPPAEG